MDLDRIIGGLLYTQIYIQLEHSHALKRSVRDKILFQMILSF